MTRVTFQCDDGEWHVPHADRYDCDDCEERLTGEPGQVAKCPHCDAWLDAPDDNSARAAAGLTEPPCIAGDHYPNDAGTACYYCELPAEPVDPQELAEALYYAQEIAARRAAYDPDRIDIERDRAQQARAGGSALLRLYATMTRPSRPWDISLVYSPGAAQLDDQEATYQRVYRAGRDTGLNLTRAWWPIMLDANR